VAPSRDQDGRTLRQQGAFRVAIYERRAGSWPEMFDPARRRWMGRLLGRIHAIGSIRDFVHRPRLDAKTFGHDPREFLLASDSLAPGVVSRYESTTAELLGLVEGVLAPLADDSYIRVHGDCHGGNVLWREEGPVFVDFDDSRMAPAVQDLWMFVEGTPDERRGQVLDLLEGYEDFTAFDYRQLRMMEALRALRLVHYAAWLARRWDDPAFPRAFPWFGTDNYWEEHILNLREQCELLSDAGAWSLH